MKKISSKNYLVPLLLIGVSIYQQQYYIGLIAIITIIVIIINNKFGDKYSNYNKHKMKFFKY